MGICFIQSYSILSKLQMRFAVVNHEIEFCKVKRSIQNIVILTFRQPLGPSVETQDGLILLIVLNISLVS